MFIFAIILPIPYEVMRQPDTTKAHARCVYVKACYLAEDLKCYGFKTDCPLYMKSNNEVCSESRFHDAMDKLIDETRAKHLAIDSKK